MIKYNTRHFTNKYSNVRKNVKQNDAFNSNFRTVYHTSNNQFIKTSSSNDMSIATNLIEEILKETYQAPDYETAIKIQQNGFPDFATYKQALDNRITTYAEWLEYQKKK